VVLPAPRKPVKIVTGRPLGAGSITTEFMVSGRAFATNFTAGSRAAVWAGSVLPGLGAGYQWPPADRSADLLEARCRPSSCTLAPAGPQQSGWWLESRGFLGRRGQGGHLAATHFSGLELVCSPTSSL
jgi:hypothetical protein